MGLRLGLSACCTQAEVVAVDAVHVCETDLPHLVRVRVRVKARVKVRVRVRARVRVRVRVRARVKV